MALDKKLKDFDNALSRLEESINKTNAYKAQEEYTFFRDSTIQRFEFTLEIAWKSIKQFLLEHDGLECRSPKACMREFFSVGYLNEEEISLLLQMVDDRNLATHTYHEALANDIFSHIKSYEVLLKRIYELMLSR